jgi:hypothetical protein
MKFILLIFLLGVIVYYAIRMMSSLAGKAASPPAPVVLQPAITGIDISITDTGRGGMPVITIRSTGATLNIQSVKQDSGQYIVSAEKQADNVAVVFVDEKI